jgi:CRISPR system Cascade subunit CasD
MQRHLLLVLEGPLQSWGTVLVDQIGRIDDFPPMSLVVGLLGNALGYDRTDAEHLAALQGRCIMGTVILRQGHRITDDQNAKLEKSDTGWTTSGRPEGRAGGSVSYESPHRRRRDYAADAIALVAVRLEPAESLPDLDALAQALTYPSRPLFLGRKPCAPARPILAGTCETPSIPDALRAGISLAAPQTNDLVPIYRSEIDTGPFHARWPIEEGLTERGRIVDVFEERDFRNDIHIGWRRRVVATLPAPQIEAG